MFVTQTYKFKLATYWANNDQVRKALHIREVKKYYYYYFNEYIVNPNVFFFLVVFCREARENGRDVILGTVTSISSRVLFLIMWNLVLKATGL